MTMIRSPMIIAGAVLEDFRIERLLGRGAGGSVYEATQLSLERTVAVKVLGRQLSEDPHFVRRFDREGRIQAALEHPHVLTVYAAGRSEEGLYIAMQLVEGGMTLADRIGHGALDAARALRLVGEVAGALDAAHEAGLLHRDVKPQNVLVDREDRAYLADFGLTRESSGPNLTATGTVLGTVEYLAPEVVLGRAATPAADRYALAAVLYECLTGDVVFPRATNAATLYAHAHEPPPRISVRRPGLPAALDAVFEAALAKEPERRPRSAAGLVAEVADALGDGLARRLGPPPARAPATEEPAAAAVAPAPSPGRRPLVIATVAGALAGALAVGAILLVGGGNDDATDGQPPPAARGAAVLGSDLSGEADVTANCRGHAQARAAPACSLMQSRLPGRPLVAARDGVISSWAVRGAKGDMSIQVLRAREERFQVSKSEYETVPDRRWHSFSASLAIERGDEIGLVLGTGASIGLREAPGARTLRWIPWLRGVPTAPRATPGALDDKEILLRVQYVPGASVRPTTQLTGVAAARAPDGKRIATRTIRLEDGGAVRAAAVEVGGAVVIDLLRAGRRFARMPVRTFAPGGELLDFQTTAIEADPLEGDVYLRWVNDGSGRLLDRYAVFTAAGFRLVD
jgi:hypothetical protein